MSSDFDKVFNRVKAEHEEIQRSAAIEKSRLAREKQQEAMTVSSIVRESLRTIGVSAARRLQELRVPTTRPNWRAEMHDLLRHLGGRKYKEMYGEDMWKLCDLRLTKDGYFMNDYDERLSGPLGFSRLIDGIQMISPDASGQWGSFQRSGQIYVDSRTKEIMINLKFSLGYDEGSKDFTYNFAERVATEILQLCERAASKLGR